jgi:hypothetical protein
MNPKTKITWSNEVTLRTANSKSTINFDQKVKALQAQAKGDVNAGLTKNL